MSEVTDPSTIPSIVSNLREGFKTHVTQSVSWRLEMLKNFRTMLSIPRNREEICHGMYLDLGRSRFEAGIYELDLTITEIDHFIHELSTNSQFDIKQVSTNVLNQPASSYVRSDPYGVVLVASPWNYPSSLCLQPLAGALAAGNTVLLRPGTYSHHTSTAIYNLIKRHFDPAFVNCVIGDRHVTTAVLKEKFDFICFTGGSSLGKIIHKAANEHLTPCLLELGGSNPVIVWKDINIPVTARRLVSTAFMNAGQTCIRPQILFTHQDVLEPFVNEMKKCINNFYQIGNDQSEYRVQAAYNAYLASKPAGTPLSIQDWIRREDNEAKENAEKNQNLDINDPKYVSNFKWIKNSPWLGRIINREAFQRLTNLIEQDRKFIVFGGEYAELNDDTPDTDLIISPTIMVFKDIRDFNNAKSVLNGEIFGPIITILAINDGARSPTANANTSLTAVIDWINSRDKPLSLYCYTFDDNVKKQVLENTSSGSLAFNDSVLQISNSNLPFGGVGMSGMGSYHGKYSLESFSHQKAVLDKGKFNVNYCDLPLRYPPYFTHAQTTMASAAALERFDFGLGNIAIAVPVLAAGAYGLYSVLPALLPVLQSGLDMLKDFYAQGPK